MNGESYVHSFIKENIGLEVILPKYKSYKTKLKNQFPFGTSRVTLDTLALVQRFHYRFLSFYLFSKGSSWTVDFFFLVSSRLLVVMRVICTSRQRSIVKKPQAIFKVLNPIHKRWCIIISSALTSLKKTLENRKIQELPNWNGFGVKVLNQPNFLILKAKNCNLNA